MLRSFRASRCHRSANKRRRKTFGKAPARRGVFRAVGWEPLEHRVLLTAAATITWTGGSAASANWSDPANWDLGRAPINGDSLVFPASAHQLANNDDIAGLSVNAITFQGQFTTASSGYTLSGDDLTVGAGGIVDDSVFVPPPAASPTFANQIGFNVALAAAQIWSSDDSYSGHHLIVNGNVNNVGFALTMTGQDLIDVSGQISGSGGLTVTSSNVGGPAPTVELQNANNYTGETDVSDGTLVVDGSTAAASALTVAPGATLGGAGTVGGKITVVGAYAPGPIRPMGPGGTLDPGAAPQPSLDTGTLSNTGGVTFETPPILSPGTAISGNPPLAAFAVQLGGTAANPTNDELDSAGTVALAEATLELTTLAGAGPFNAGQQFVIIQAGAPISGTFLGVPEGSTVSDGTQEFTISYANDRVTLTTLPPATPGVITWTGAVDGNWSVPGNWDLDRAPVNGDSLVFPATAQHLGNTNEIGALSVNSITFQGTFNTGLGGYALMGDGLTVGAGGIVDNSSESGSASYYIYNYVDLNLALGANQTWSNNGSPSFPLVIVGNVANGGFTLTTTGTGIIDVSGQISGSGGLIVDGGTLELENANSYLGATFAEQGALLVDGSIADTSAVAVNAGATLGGIGAIGGRITVWGPGGLVSSVGGTLDPGAGPDPSKDTGTLSNTGGVAFEPNPLVSPATPNDASRIASFAVQLGGTAANPTNDQLDSTGTVAFVDATFLDLTTLAGAGPYNAGQQFVIVQAGAPITTTFAGLPEGSTVSDGTQNFTISYANDRVTLTALQAVSTVMDFYLNGQAGDNSAATFVHNLYRELLGREPDAAGQTYWVNFFAQDSSVGGPAAAQRTLVADFLDSPEYGEHLLEVLYTNFLHRTADAGGLAFWTAQLAAGVDEKTVLADILGSDEYFTDAQGHAVHPFNIADPTVEQAQAWVSALYRDLLGRTADAGGLAFWTQQALNQDTASGRAAVAFQFLGAPEVEHKLLNGDYPRAAGSVGAPGRPALSLYGEYALSDLTGNGWDNLYFQGHLSANEVDALFAQLQAGELYGETIAGMLEMQQYFG